MTELEDNGKDLVVKILHLFLQSSQPLKFKIRDLEDKRHAGCFLPPTCHDQQNYLRLSLKIGHRSDKYEPKLEGAYCNISLTYLHHLIAHPAEVSPFSGFLPQQVMCVAAESSLTIQTQSYSTHGPGTEKRNSQDYCALAILNKL